MARPCPKAAVFHGPTRPDLRGTLKRPGRGKVGRRTRWSHAQSRDGCTRTVTQVAIASVGPQDRLLFNDREPTPRACSHRRKVKLVLSICVVLSLAAPVSAMRSAAFGLSECDRQPRSFPPMLAGTKVSFRPSKLSRGRSPQRCAAVAGCVVGERARPLATYALSCLTWASHSRR